LSHRPLRQYLNAEDLQDLLHLPPHEVRSIVDLDQAEEPAEFLTTYTTRMGGYSSLSVLLEAM
jgi:hypothetical protein